MLGYRKLMFVNIKVTDVEDYGSHTALVLGCLRSWSAWQGDPETGKCYLPLAEIARYTGLSYKTVQRSLPTEEMGWRHYSGYVPGTTTKTTWWEPVEEDRSGKSDLDSQSNSKDLDCESKSNIYNIKDNKVCALHAHSGRERPLEPTVFPGGNKSGEAAKEDGGVVKITTPPKIQSVKDKTKAADRRKHMQFCQELLDRMGAGGVKAGGIFAKRITQLKAQGYDDETLRQVAGEARLAKVKDEFYAEPMKAFSESGVSGLVAKMENKKTKSKADEIEERMFKSGLYY